MKLLRESIVIITRVKCNENLLYQLRLSLSGATLGMEKGEANACHSLVISKVFNCNESLHCISLNQMHEIK